MANEDCARLASNQVKVAWEQGRISGCLMASSVRESAQVSLGVSAQGANLSTKGSGKFWPAMCVCACRGLHQQLELDYHLRCCMSWCQQLGRLGSRTSQWADHVSEPRCWRELTCTCVYILLPGGPPSCSVMYVCFVYGCLLGTHAHKAYLQACYWLDLRTLSCSSLASFGLFDLA